MNSVTGRGGRLAVLLVLVSFAVAVAVRGGGSFATLLNGEGSQASHSTSEVDVFGGRGLLQALERLPATRPAADGNRGDDGGTSTDLSRARPVAGPAARGNVDTNGGSITDPNRVTYDEVRPT